MILKLCENNFSFFKYFLFTYFKMDKIYEKNIENNVFLIPFKKTLKHRYLLALTRFLKRKKIDEICVIDDLLKDELRNSFSIINGKNIYRTIFCDILNFMSENKLYNYEIIFVSDNINEIKNLAQKCVKNVKTISVLTQKPYLYESMRDFFLQKYGVMLNIKGKKDKLKKHNKIYVNCGANKIYDKTTFKNVNILDIYNVYEGAYRHIILDAEGEAKKITKLLKCPYSLALAEFLNGVKKEKNYKIVNIKK